MGIILYVLMAGCYPFDHEDSAEIGKKIIKNVPDYEFEPWNTSASPEVKDLCLKLLNKNSAKRPKIEEVMDHPWFACFKK